MKSSWQSIQRAGRALELFCLLGAASVAIYAAPPARIRGNIESTSTFILKGNVHPIPAAARDEGPVEPSLNLSRITLHFAMTSAQQADLHALLEAQQTRGSSQYHKWLTPEQFADRFGVSQSDVDKITNWLESQGFSDIEVSRSRTSVSFSGNAAQVEQVFGTTLHRFDINGISHYANISNPVMPAALQGVVLGIRGLNDFRPKPRVRPFRPRFTSSITGNTFLTPGDFATIYDLKPVYNGGIDGTGRAIAVAGQSDIHLADIEAFRAAAGLPANDPQIVLFGADPGENQGDESEADLDVEWSGGIAPNAHIVYVNSNDAFTSANYAIQNNLADVLILTYGACEPSLQPSDISENDAMFQMAASEGITVVVASGDDGAADCDEGPANGTPPAQASQGPAVDFPASDPYVTGVGGTEFNEGTGTYWQAANATTGDIVSSALSYIPEVAWNDTTENGYLSASGGGASTKFVKPSWQAGNGVPADGARDVPDVSFNASADHDGYLICSAIEDSDNKSGGNCTNGFRDAGTALDPVGGTSAAVPPMAAIIALIDQQSNERQGNINPNLYAVASVSTDAFHDITAGNNVVPCVSGSTGCPASGQFGFTAGPGYDEVTGLGTIDVYNLLREWNVNFQIAVSPSTLSVNPGSSGTATVTVTPSGGFDGAVTFSCTTSAGLANTTCSIPGTISGSGTATLTVTAASNAAAPGHERRFFIWPGNYDWPLLAATLAFAALAFFVWPKKRTRAAAIAWAALALGAASCGGGNSSSGASMGLQSVAESGTVTITATSGVITRTATLNVTVQ
jgi:subtilase family serine protease